ncbi:hypothetical protein [Pseudomonas sp. MWU13-2100]|uniref:hypothetical protein n=1 Tax=Pseudomonas sp. MWU13-2100 TaxID=2935075 RepID=UPI00200D859F|nr:hypothetical protein [Pseudomonas sp. MWU13-2100]
MNSRKREEFTDLRSGRSFAANVSAAVLLLLLAVCSFSDLKPQSSLLSPGDAGETLANSGIALSPAAWPSETWWTSFNDAQLNTLVEEALANR